MTTLGSEMSGVNHYSKSFMGSGTKRKENDVVRINRPKAKKGSEGSGGGRDINVTCPMAFEVRIESIHPLLGNAPVTIRGGELFVNGELVGKLLARQLQMVTRCAENNIRYSGNVLKKEKNRTYARFTQDK